MDNLIAVFKALADKNRLRVVSALMGQHELCACELTEMLEISGATVSRHMDVLIAAGVVLSRKDGRWVHYQLNRDLPEFNELYDWIKARLKKDSDATRDRKHLKRSCLCQKN